MENLFIIGAVAGAVQFLKLLQVKNYWGAGTIFVSGLIGAVAGVFGIQGIDVSTGIVAGLAASGLITAAQKINTGTTESK